MTEATLVDIEMPAMGESVTEGTVLEWHVAEGDSVDEGQTVIEVSTDKVDAEVPAPAPGTITKLLVAPDDVVKVGQPLAEMAAGAAPGGDGAASKPKAEAATATPLAANGDGAGQRRSPDGSPGRTGSSSAASRARGRAARSPR